MAGWTGRRVQRMAQVVKATYGYECWLCRRPITNDDEYSIDHVVPRSKGGNLWDIDNMRPAHLNCNRIRGNREPKRISPPPAPSRKW